MESSKSGVVVRLQVDEELTLLLGSEESKDWNNELFQNPTFVNCFGINLLQRDDGIDVRIDILLAEFRHQMVV